jgi:hypothetical protein
MGFTNITLNGADAKPGGSAHKGEDMEIIQPMQEPKGANGNRVNGHRVVSCPRDKKPFVTQLEAAQFEAENRKRFPNQGKQYAYKCEECPAYHLTSKPPDAYALQKTNLKRLESLATAGASARATPNRRGRGETEAEVKRLWEQGLSDAEIATQIGITHAGASHHRKKFGAANKRGERNLHLSQPKAPVTIPEYDEQKRLLDEEYQSKPNALEQHKRRLEEANKLTVSECGEGKSVFIGFGHHERMVVPKDKVTELTNSLMQWV